MNPTPAARTTTLPEIPDSPSQPETGGGAQHPGIALKRIDLTHLRLDERETGSEQGTAQWEPIADFKFDIDRSVDDRLWARCKVTLQDFAPGVPIRLEAELRAEFVVIPGQHHLPLLSFAQVQAPAFMFPFIRELIADVTKRTAYGAFYLPAMNMHALVGRQSTTLTLEAPVQK
jgi:preprotein translocase subunit SecB